jgi:hypothetical protein
VVGNVNNFLGNFSQGGWNEWFNVTQNNANNPYGAFLDAQIELDNRIAQAIGVESQIADWNEGFLSFTKCEGYEIPGTISASGLPECVDASGNPTPRTAVTPGSVIGEQVHGALSAPLQRVINAQGLENLVNAFVTGVLNRYVFGSTGLF